MAEGPGPRLGVVGGDRLHQLGVLLHEEGPLGVLDRPVGRNGGRGEPAAGL